TVVERSEREVQQSLLLPHYIAAVQLQDLWPAAELELVFLEGGLDDQKRDSAVTKRRAEAFEVRSPRQVALRIVITGDHGQIPRRGGRRGMFLTLGRDPGRRRSGRRAGFVLRAEREVFLYRIAEPRLVA